MRRWRYLGPDLDALKAEIADEPRQSAALARLRVIADERQKVLQESIDLYNSGKRDEAAAPARLDHAKALMDSARSIVASMRAEQDRRLTERTAGARRLAGVVLIGLLSIVMAMMVLGAFVRSDLLHRLAENREPPARRSPGKRPTGKAAEARVRQMQKVEAIDFS